MTESKGCPLHGHAHCDMCDFPGRPIPDLAALHKKIDDLQLELRTLSIKCKRLQGQRDRAMNLITDPWDRMAVLNGTTRSGKPKPAPEADQQ